MATIKQSVSHFYRLSDLCAGCAGHTSIEGGQLACPSCGSHNVAKVKHPDGFIWYFCRKCGHEW